MRSLILYDGDACDAYIYSPTYKTMVHLILMMLTLNGTKTKTCVVSL